MSSSAIRSQNTIIRISTASGSAKTITGITAADPPVVTSTAHGLSAGTVVVIDSVSGMVEVNGRAFVIANPATDTFELKGVDGSGYTAYSSGGTATSQTMTEIVNVRSASLFEGTTPELDKTNLRSTSKEYDLDIPDRGGGSLAIDIDPTDPGQDALKAAHFSTSTKAFTCTLRTGHAAAFMALVQSYPTTFGVGQHVQANIALRITGSEAWFA